MKEILNKDKVTAGVKQYHIAMEEGDVGEYVLLPGDPKRSDRVAKYLENPVLVADHREHRTFTGYYKGTRVSVTSTGMGCPSTAIAVEELIKIGGKVFIRIGSSAGLQDHIAIGDILISQAAMKNEGTSKFYVPECFPAVPDFTFTHDMTVVAREMTADSDLDVHVGITATDDAFYGESPEFIESLVKLGVQNVEMEASALFTIAHLRSVKAACICGASGNLKTGDVIYQGENTRLIEAWDKEIQIVLETIYMTEERKKASAAAE